jgi:hypothetical protein
MEKTVDLYQFPVRDFSDARERGKITGYKETPRWDLYDTRFLLPATMPNGLRLIFLAADDLINRNGPFKDTTLGSFQTRILDTAKKQGIQLYQAKFERAYFNLATPNSITDALSLLFPPMTNNADRTVVFLVLRKKNTQTYHHFKDLTDRTFGIHSICLTEEPNFRYDKKQYKNVPFGQFQYFGNVMMKFNLKFGGINHSTAAVRSRTMNTLVLGADLSHPGPGSINGCPSIAAIVGSVDDDGGRFLGSMRLQTKNESDREVWLTTQILAARRTNCIRSFISLKTCSWSASLPGPTSTNGAYQTTSSTIATVSQKAST